MNILALLAGLFSGMLGSMGLGGGAVLIIYLSFFADKGQFANQGINLLFFIPIAIFACIIYAKNKQIKFKIVIPIAIGGLIGAVIGIFLADIAGAELLAKLFGGFLCILGVKEIFTVFKKKDK
ncbi:MAG: sulfite exporter TauE/SafE family protein [Clostridia bacterium]|nr:sulfite exporter TauE/SafE family protein [Clostridia bacterium]